MKGNFKDQIFVNKIEDKLRKEIKFAIFQMEKLSNLSKLQKVGLIFSSPERIKTLELLREGPISRKVLTNELEKIKDNPNLDLIISPFLELNLVRRDWARGTHDQKQGFIIGEGEYLFLVKDIALIRKIPTQVMEQMKKNEHIGAEFEKIVTQFYGTYDPFDNLLEESKTLGKFLLDPDVFDLLSLLRTQVYPLAKMPKIMSDFANFDSIIAKLLEDHILVSIKDAEGREWVCMLSDITPLVVFPEYILGKIKTRVEIKPELQNEESMEKYLTQEVARKGLDLLEATYSEKLEF
jgi:hypothetical protein